MYKVTIAHSRSPRSHTGNRREKVKQLGVTIAHSRSPRSHLSVTPLAVSSVAVTIAHSRSPRSHTLTSIRGSSRSSVTIAHSRSPRSHEKQEAEPQEQKQERYNRSLAIPSFPHGGGCQKCSAEVGLQSLTRDPLVPTAGCLAWL